MPKSIDKRSASFTYHILRHLAWPVSFDKFRPRYSAGVHSFIRTKHLIYRQISRIFPNSKRLNQYVLCYIVLSVSYFLILNCYTLCYQQHIPKERYCNSWQRYKDFLNYPHNSRKNYVFIQLKFNFLLALTPK